MLQHLNNNMQYSDDLLDEQIKYNNREKFNNLVQKEKIIEGYFQEDIYRKEMYIRKINTTLCAILGMFILVAMVSYYFVSINEMEMNKLSKQITALNDENADLQYKLDKLKSLSNVDITMQKSKALTRAKQVIEVQEVNTINVVDKKNNSDKLFSYSIGY